MLEQLITVYVGAGIIGITYVAWLLSGAFNVAYSRTRVWSWRRFLEDLLKVFLRLGFLGAITIAIDLVEWYCARLGADVARLAEVFSVGGVAALTAKASAGYTIKAYNNFKNFIDTLHSTNIEFEPEDVDWGGIMSDVTAAFREAAEMITPKHTTDDEQTEATAEPSADEVAEIAEALEVGQGAEVLPISRILPDGDNDAGKGWQCSKYAWFLATGTRMNYAPHPDYGPCNGDKMVDFLIQKLGWVECAKMDGAIFSYAGGQYGHTGIVKNAAQNLVNDANWQPLKVGTHYLNLDAVGARYACPKTLLLAEAPAKTEAAAKPADAPKVAEAKPANAPARVDFAVGDKVRPLRKVDYDGRHLRQYDDHYTITELRGNRAVLTARGQVWAAMRVEDIELV